MIPRYLHTLEFDKILTRLASHTAFSASEELARALTPSPDAEEIARRQGETTEARALLDQHPEIGIGGARDARPLTKHARLGAILAPTDLLEIRQTLLAARTLRRALGKLGALYPRLAGRAAHLEDAPRVVDAVTRAINDRGEVADSASDTLARIRRDLNTTRNRLTDKLQRMISASSNAKVIQEPIITQRDGRYVIPVRAEAKGRIPGIVHDTSASGATLFIEPLAVVEMGNRVRELEREEAREVERILRELTALVAAHADAVDLAVDTLAELDLAFAKARYSEEIKGVEPKLTIDNWKLEIVDARHPLLDPEKVVPISLRLGGEFTILVITGPNTGGKTVTLKTIGLLALMAQSGLHIPAKEGSRLPVFSGVYADIGDEQSIEQSLSTFSSHLRNIVEILRAADARALVLLDELGAGTDPVEGSALARAILAHLLAHKIPALVATHYAELKAFAHTTPGVQNASMEFDVDTLSPTFHLTMGLPGQSNAFAIASRLGLDEEIIAHARGALTRSDVELETMLAQIKQTQQDAASARAHAELAQREAEQMARQAREKLAEIERTRAEILERARAEAQAEIARAREELNRLQQEWRDASRAREFVENEQTKLDALEEQLPALPSPALPPPEAGEGSRVGVGDRVFVPRLGQSGQVTALDDNGAEVQVGNFRVRLRMDELGGSVAEPASPRAGARGITLPESASPGIEISLRGLRADDAANLLEKYLDRAYLAGLPYVRVVHGKGTGALRKLTRDLLREHPLVAEMRAAAEHEGGDGVTIVKFVSR
jgi:DNA mismatch repair protein MutS2